jgi:hypothetical protein
VCTRAHRVGCGWKKIFRKNFARSNSFKKITKDLQVTQIGTPPFFGTDLVVARKARSPHDRGTQLSRNVRRKMEMPGEETQSRAPAGRAYHRCPRRPRTNPSRRWAVQDDKPTRAVVRIEAVGCLVAPPTVLGHCCAFDCDVTAFLARRCATDLAAESTGTNCAT